MVFFTLSKKRGPGAEWRRARKPQNSSSFWPSVALAEKAVGVKKPSIRRSERDSAAFADGFDAVFGRYFACGDPPDCTTRTSGSRQSGTLAARSQSCQSARRPVGRSRRGREDLGPFDAVDHEWLSRFVELAPGDIFVIETPVEAVTVPSTVTPTVRANTRHSCVRFTRVGRSFTGGDLHSLLLAGLPAHALST